jgi:hypothetical protein
MQGVKREVWFRNPTYYLLEVFENTLPSEGLRLVWQAGHLRKRDIEPHEYITKYGWKITDKDRLIIVDTDFAYELDMTDKWQCQHWKTPTKVLGCWPVWRYGVHSASLLKSFISKPISENPPRWAGRKLEAWMNPVPGQEHRVFTEGLLPTSVFSAAYNNDRLIMSLGDACEIEPSLIVHMHGVYAWTRVISSGIRSFDYQPREQAANGDLFLANGRYVKSVKEDQSPIAPWSSWLSVIGMKAGDMKVPRNRCIANIRSVRWACENYDQIEEIYDRKGNRKARAASKVIPLSLVNNYKLHPLVDDCFLCDSCSLSTKCKSFRAGAVCGIPGAVMADLAKLLKTRDSAKIIEGLGELLALSAGRLKEGIERENDKERVDPEVTKLTKVILDGGIQLAKLVDPALAAAGAGKTQINVGVGINNAAGQVSSATPQQLMANIVRSLEQQGVAREDITMEMIMGYAAPSVGRVLDVPSLGSPQ